MSEHDSNAEEPPPVIEEPPPVTVTIKYCGSNCNKSISESDDKLVCERCRKHFLLECTSFNRKVFKVVKKNKCFEDVLWRCDPCKRAMNQEPSSNILMDMILQLRDRVTNLEKHTSSTKSLHVKKSSTEARAQPIEDRTTHQVIISLDANEKHTEQTFAEKVKSNLSSVPVTSVKVIKDGQGVINFPDKSSRDVGLSNLAKDFKAEANNRPQRMLLPKITIFGIRSSDYTNSDHEKLKHAICEKNPSLKSLIDNGKVFEILFIKDDWRRSGSSLAVVKVDKDIYSAILQQKRQIYIDFSRCHISDRFRVIQCYRCQQFGHVSSNCASPSQVCRYCSECHNSQNCPFKSNPGNYKCPNCKMNHTSNSTKCSVLQSQVEILMKHTQGMESRTKNDLRPSAIIT